ncbi:conserved hypothetical protein [Frankia canadensis]|uniref:Uncharacterized protein n=1 Tax=Frankia canadensis TaxID=1836972 RepID=A0A2I2L1Y5_9ACTN|nr:hypothetical protein [Frankia canadensis]SNQ51919.1 conserved hypothetical protein [Frankia canadensis]SOU59209.1 conserved hypothetical protein [Frankia canadensis]
MTTAPPASTAPPSGTAPHSGTAPPSGTAPTGEAAPSAGAQAARLGALLLGQLSELLAGLRPDEVDALLAGRARLALTTAPAGTTPPSPRTPRPAKATSSAAARAGVAGAAPPPKRPATGDALPASVDVEEVRAALLGAASREEAAAHLAGLRRVTAPQLRALAAALGVDGVAGRDPKATVIRKIVDGTVGFRISSRALRGDDVDL